MSPVLKNMLICCGSGMIALLVFYPIEVMSWFGQAPRQQLETDQTVQTQPTETPNSSHKSGLY